MCLFPNLQNFLALCASDYYKGCIFHRNIKGFIVQTGDPTGTGKNGQSIWKKRFKDEFHDSLRHNARGIMSMANNGPDSNGSQFFITYSKQTMLDMKYSIFGKYYHTSSDQNQINIDYVMMSADSKPYPFPNGLHLFGQLVIGPPGSGKTTYCAVMHDFLVKLGRKVAVINLDPANDSLPYPCAINMADLICLDEVMDYLSLGPNGGLIYCMEYLYTNRSWLANQLAALKQKDPKIYLIFDLPGQVELYTHHPCMRQLVCYLTNKPTNFKINTKNQLSLPSSSKQSSSSNDEVPNSLDLQLTSVHLIDSHYCSDAGKFIACVLTSLSAMLQLSIPHVNILSKADLIEQYGELDFNLDFFTEVLDLQYLIDCLHKTTNNTDQLLFNCKYTRLNQAIIDLIQDHSIVQFLLLDIQDLSHIERVMRYVDRANGYVFGTNEQHNLQSLLHSASGVELAPDWIGMIQEKYMSKKNDDNHNIDNNVQNDDEPHIDLFA